MSARRKFDQYAIGDNINNAVRDTRRQVARLQAAEGKDSEISETGEGVQFDPAGITYAATDEASPFYLLWRLLGSGEPTGHVTSFEVSDDSASGIVLAGVKTAGAAKGLVFLNAYDSDMTTIKAQLIVDTLQNFQVRQYYDNTPVSRRDSPLPAAGWLPFAYPIGLQPAATPVNAGLSVNALRVSPVVLGAPMLLRSVSFWNTDTTGGRKWNWHLFRQTTQTEDSSENTLTRVTFGTAAEAFTASAASLRTIAANSAPVYIPPGAYWLGVQNEHASNTLGMGSHATSMGLNTAQSKGIGSVVSGNIDFVAATWTKSQSIFFKSLNGEVFGESTAF